MGDFVKKEILYDNINSIMERRGFVNVTLNSHNLISEKIEISRTLLDEAGLLRSNGDIIIPVYAKLLNRSDIGSTIEYIFNYNGNIIDIDLLLENESEYIGE